MWTGSTQLHYNRSRKQVSLCMLFTCFLLSSLLLIASIPIINDWQLCYWQSSLSVLAWSLALSICHFKVIVLFDSCHEVLVIWCNLLSAGVAKLNEQFTCCFWYNSDVAVKIILILQSKLLSLTYLCLPVLMREIHSEEISPQPSSSHPFLKVVFSSCFWLCAPSSDAAQPLQVSHRSLLNPCPMSSSSVTGSSPVTPFLLLTVCCRLFTCDSPCSQWKSMKWTF